MFRLDGMGGAASGEVASRIFIETARKVFEQHVSAGEKTDQQSIDHVVLADDAACDLSSDLLDEA